MDALGSLQTLQGGFESISSKTVLYGVDFHHAGLPIEEKDIVPEAYDQGILKVMVTTRSLAAGINLPARPVILNDARRARTWVDRQCSIRCAVALAAKARTKWERVYLWCHKADLEAVAELLGADLPLFESWLTFEKRGVKRALLEVLVTQLAGSRSALEDYVRRSFFWQTTNHVEVLATVDMISSELARTKLVQ